MIRLEESKKIPIHVLETLHSLERAGFEAFVVCGCVRDIFLE